MIVIRARVVAPLIAAVLALSPEAAANPPAPSPAPIRAALAFEKFTLPNGLTVIVHEDRRASVVAIQLAFRVGSRDDPRDRRGMARLMRSLLADGSTRHVNDDDRSELLSTMGTDPWITTVDADSDDTSIALTVPSAALDLALWMESDRMAFLADGIEDGTVAHARENLAREDQAGLSAPYAHVLGEIRSAIHGPGHPYGRITASSAELASVTPAEVRARMRAWYGPANAVLTLAGDVTKDRARSVVVRYFGSIVGGPRPPVAPPAAALPAGERRVRFEAAVDAPRVIFAWPTAPAFQPDDIVLDEVANVLQARLDERIEGTIAKDVFAAQMSRWLASEFVVMATLLPGHTPDEARAAMEREIARIQAEDPSPQEAERAGLTHLTSRLFRADPPSGRAATLTSFEVATGDPGGFGGYASAYRAASPAPIRAAALKFLRADRRIVAEVVPTPGAPSAGRITGGKSP